MRTDFAEQLIATLPHDQAGLFNPWRQRCDHDTESNTVESKVERLARHLDCNAQLILVGEAPGYQGCRYSGIAFTSERLLLEGAIPRLPAPAARLSTRKLPFSEPSATIVWRTLKTLGIADTTILWNTVQLHPYKGTNPWTNRTPGEDELALGVPALQLLRKFYPNARFVAVGKKAASTLDRNGIPFLSTVRHPANGGATLFAQGLKDAAAAL